MQSAISSGLRSVDAGVNRLDNAAARIARDGADGDLAGNVVDLVKAKLEVRLGAGVIRTADETIGSLIDVLA